MFRPKSDNNSKQHESDRLTSTRDHVLDLSDIGSFGLLTADNTQALQNNPSYKVLNLSNNHISFLTINDVASVISNNITLVEVNLAYNNLGNRGVEILLQSFIENPNSNIQILNLSHNNIDYICPSIIASFLTSKSCLTSLNLDYNTLNPIHGSGSTIQDIFQALERNTSLRKLTLNNVCFLPSHVEDIIHYLRSTKPLEILELGNVNAFPVHRLHLLLTLAKQKGAVITFENSEYHYQSSSPHNRRSIFSGVKDETQYHHQAMQKEPINSKFYK